MYAASTAPEMTWIAAVRMPAKITGSAMGSLTLRTRSIAVMPMPRAASTTSGSTPRIAVQVLIRIGGSASSVSANSAGAKPVPSSGITSARIASEGSVRPTLAALMATSAPRRLCATQMPTGTASTIAIASADADSVTCVDSAVANWRGCAAR